MDENSNASALEGVEARVEQNTVPTEVQEKLRRRYGRMIGWYGVFALLFLSLAVYNVIKGLNSFASVPMLIELALGVGFALPAIWANRRRAKLDAFVEEGSTAIPRHIKTWQHMLVLVIGVPMGISILSVVAVGLIAASGPSEEELRSEEALSIREIIFSALDETDQKTIANMCRNLADPGFRGNARQTFGQEIKDSSTNFTHGELVQIHFNSYLEYCGLTP